MNPKLLNLGCGSFVHEDWVNVDFVSTRKGVIAHNLLKGIPFPNDSFDAVYHSHVLEHFPKDKALPFLRECFRVLKPGGVIRVVVPDLEGIAREYLKWLESAEAGKEHAESNYEWMMLELLDQLVRDSCGGEMASYLKNDKIPNQSFVNERIGADIQDSLLLQRKQLGAMRQLKIILIKTIKITLSFIFGKHYEYYFVGRFRSSGEIHKWMYDKHSLSKLLAQSGFNCTRIMNAYSSNITNFNKYKLDIYNNSERGSSSIYLEAIKPFNL